MKTRYQVMGYSATGYLVHAGMRSAARVTQRTAERWEHEWRTWRKRYLRAVHGDYPLRQAEPTTTLRVMDVDTPGKFDRTFAV